MQKAIEALVKMKPIVTVICQGDFFTVARASVDTEGRIFYAEGIARRSYKDKPSENGKIIAEGRAMKALAKKVICKKKVHHRFMA